jgi:hypothetical protein
MPLPVIVIGDDAKLYLTLQKEGATFNIDAGDTVEAALVSADHESMLMDEVAQSSATSGADWANSLIAIKFTAAQTELINKPSDEDVAKVAVQVTQSGKKETWFSPVKIVQGHIA